MSLYSPLLSGCIHVITLKEDCEIFSIDTQQALDGTKVRINQPRPAISNQNYVVYSLTSAYGPAQAQPPLAWIPNMSLSRMARKL